MSEGVTLEQLRTLRAVAEEGSFSAAARRLGRVQAAVSQSIDRLEAQLGLRLFDRTSRVPTLTRHGEALVAMAAKIHDDVEGFDALVATLKGGVETRLAVVVDAMFPREALVGFAREFAREHPTVELTLHVEALSAVTALVRDRRASLGVASVDVDVADLDPRHVTDIRLVPVAAPSHPLAIQAGPLGREALSVATQVVLSERSPAGQRGSDDRGVLSPRTWRVDDLGTKHALITGGVGWGHLPEHVVRDDLRAGRLVTLRLDAWGDAPPTRSLFLVRRPGAALGPVARWSAARLVDLCRGALDDHPA